MAAVRPRGWLPADGQPAPLPWRWLARSGLAGLLRPGWSYDSNQMMVIHVCGLTTPVTGSREPRWKARTTVWVCAPK
jgi:hypothetical protein